MKTVSEMQNFLKGGRLALTTNPIDDVTVTAEVVNVDKSLYRMIRRKAAVTQRMGDGYLAAVICDAILEQKHAPICATITAQATRHKRDLFDPLLGRDIARARAKRKLYLRQYDAIYTIERYLDLLGRVLIQCESIVKDQLFDADDLHEALMVVSSSRPHYPIDVSKQASNEKVSPATESEPVAVSEPEAVPEPATEQTFAEEDEGV